MAKASKATGVAKKQQTTAKAGTAAGKAPAKKAAPTGQAAKKEAAAKKAPAKKAAIAKAPAKKAAVAKTPAKKAADARKGPTERSATTKKAPATAAGTGKAAAKAPARTSATKKATATGTPSTRKTGGTGAGRRARSSTPFDAEFLAAQRKALLDKREELLREAQVLTAEADELAQMREPGDVQFDEESGEGDTLAVERERDLALAASFRGQIEEIDHALAKIDAGTYGLCEVSGQPIPKERLRAIPWARERVEFKVGGFGRR